MFLKILAEFLSFLKIMIFEETLVKTYRISSFSLISSSSIKHFKQTSSIFFSQSKRKEGVICWETFAALSILLNERGNSALKTITFVTYRLFSVVLFHFFYVWLSYHYNSFLQSCACPKEIYGNLRMTLLMLSFIFFGYFVVLVLSLDYHLLCLSRLNFQPL